MFETLRKIIKYPRLTQNYPKSPEKSTTFIGCPELNLDKCTRCGECAARCPAGAVVLDKRTQELGINLDQCIFCSLCADVCPTGAISMTQRFELAEKDRNQLRFRPLVIEDTTVPDLGEEAIAAQLQGSVKKILGRSLQIREVDAGSCNGCDYEINALSNSYNDSERLGISFVASPRHADMLLVTGTATRNMQQALVKTYNATPDPKLVVAVGACACSGGIFRDSYATLNGIDRLVPVDVYVPGCPPRPKAILYGILKALDRL